VGGAYVIGRDLVSDDLVTAGIGDVELKSKASSRRERGCGREVLSKVAIVVDGRYIPLEMDSTPVNGGVTQKLELNRSSSRRPPRQLLNCSALRAGKRLRRADLIRGLVFAVALLAGGCAGSNVRTTPAVAGYRAVDLMPGFWEFWSAAERLPADEQAKLFRSTLVAKHPEVYRASVIGLDAARPLDESSRSATRCGSR
jgi:hypothetical protein